MSSGEENESRRERFERAAVVVYEPLQRFAKRRVADAVADDVVADTLLVLWRRLDEVVEGDELAWCYGVARRSLANHHRSAVRSRRLFARLSSTTPPATLVTAAADATVASDHDFRVALAGLAAGDRELLTLWAWEGLEARDIAVALDITANAAAIRLHRAKQRLRQQHDRRKDPRPAGHSTARHMEHE